MARPKKDIPEEITAEVVQPSQAVVQQTTEIVVGESGLTNKQVAILQKTLLKGFTPDEMGLTFHMAKSLWANIFAKELWAIKDKKGNLVNIVARDFLKKKAYENNKFSSFVSGSVFEKDDFEFDQWNGKVIKHIIKDAFGKTRGPCVGAYCIGHFTDWTSVSYLARMSVYKPKDPNFYSPWKDQDEDMIIKCAEAVILKKFACLGTVYTEEEAHHVQEAPGEYKQPERPSAKKLANILK